MNHWHLTKKINDSKITGRFNDFMSSLSKVLMKCHTLKDFKVLMKCRSKLDCFVSVKSKLKHPPPGNPTGIWIFGKFLFKFPLPETEKLFKCPIIGPFQVIKWRQWNTARAAAKIIVINSKVLRCFVQQHLHEFHTFIPLFIHLHIHHPKCI